MFSTEDLLSVIDVFTDTIDQNNYTEIVIEEVAHLTDKAAKVTTDTVVEIWIPLSIMRCNTLGQIFIKTWFYDKNF